MEEKLKAFERLLIIMDELREKCPWDKKQTIESLRHLTIEETYELADAILNDDRQEIKKELGDLLLHIVFYAKIGSEKKEYSPLDNFLPQTDDEKWAHIEELEKAEDNYPYKVQFVFSPYEYNEKAKLKASKMPPGFLNLLIFSLLTQ